MQSNKQTNIKIGTIKTKLVKSGIVEKGHKYEKGELMDKLNQSLRDKGFKDKKNN